MKQRLQVPIFDIDQNLTTKDIPVLLQKGDKVVEFNTEEWKSKIDEGYTWVNGSQEESFVYGRDTGKDGVDTFPNYIQSVLDTAAFGPSFPVFKKTIIRALPFGKNTSRGHAIGQIMRGTRMLILGAFSAGELEQTHDAIYRAGWNTEAQLIDALEDYLSQQIYAPIHNPEFMQKYNIPYNIQYHEKKALAMEHIVKHVSAIYAKYFSHTHNGISIGFSDDDKDNISSIQSRAMKNIERLYEQNIDITTYHTSSKHTHKTKVI